VLSFQIVAVNPVIDEAGDLAVERTLSAFGKKIIEVGSREIL
jgi:hypothetical protein